VPVAGGIFVFPGGRSGPLRPELEPVLNLWCNCIRVPFCNAPVCGW
jgi:hypothetical protein